MEWALRATRINRKAIMTKGDLANLDIVINKLDWYIRKTKMEIEKGGLCN